MGNVFAAIWLFLKECVGADDFSSNAIARLVFVTNLIIIPVLTTLGVANVGTDWKLPVGVAGVAIIAIVAGVRMAWKLNELSDQSYHDLHPIRHELTYEEFHDGKQTIHIDVVLFNQSKRTMQFWFERWGYYFGSPAVGFERFDQFEPSDAFPESEARARITGLMLNFDPATVTDLGGELWYMLCWDTYPSTKVHKKPYQYGIRTILKNGTPDIEIRSSKWNRPATVSLGEKARSATIKVPYRSIQEQPGVPGFTAPRYEPANVVVCSPEVSPPSSPVPQRQPNPPQSSVPAASAPASSPEASSAPTSSPPSSSP